MTDKDALELLNMFITAAQIAKAQNKVEYNLKMNEVTLTELLKKAFPSLRNDINVANIVKNILKG
ncbi:MAG: hypothetical protein DKM22_00095 [Candidatus Melainabacteria bacterium]|nr:MAG: hypothetical protein DKM22_00095 [Candidatus Melainabacteria bacterium]